MTRVSKKANDDLFKPDDVLKYLFPSTIEYSMLT